MKLSEEEKRIYGVEDEKKGYEILWKIEDALQNSYYIEHSEDEQVLVTHNFLKKMLLEVARKRNIDISEGEKFNIDDILNQINSSNKSDSIDDEIKDFDILYIKDYEKMDEYIKKKFEGKNFEYMNRVLQKFESFGGISDNIRSFMSSYILLLIKKGSDLYNQSIEIEEEESVFDDPLSFAPYEEKEESNQQQEGLEEDFADFEGVWEDFDDVDWGEESYDFEENQTKQTDDKENDLTDDDIVNLVKYINTYEDLMRCKKNAIEVISKYRELANKEKLNEFYSTKGFKEDFKRIMEHDENKHEYRFHGTTTLSDAASIMNVGLGMMRDDLDSTTYREFDMDQVILYSRGFGGEIGRDAIVIIDRPIKDGKFTNIVSKFSKEKEIPFSPSGLQGLNGRPEYIVDPKYIIGYVDKVNKKVIFNPKYYDYDRINAENEESRPARLPYSEERIAEASSRINSKILDTNTKEKNK